MAGAEFAEVRDSRVTGSERKLGSSMDPSGLQEPKVWAEEVFSLDIAFTGAPRTLHGSDLRENTTKEGCRIRQQPTIEPKPGRSTLAQGLETARLLPGR